VYFLQALGSMAKPAIPALSDCLDQPDTVHQAAAILSYSGPRGHVDLGPEAIPPLLKAITNADVMIRGNAANALGLLGSKPDLVVPALLRALKDPAPEVRGTAARSFGGFKAEAATIVPPLIETLDDTNSYVRQGTIWMLGRYRAQASASVPKLLLFLNDPDFQVRKETTDALKLIDPEAAAKKAVE
jgi:HEAT repeat protein